MEFPKINPPYCQSCGTSLRNNTNLGSNYDGSMNFDFCGYCYQNGSFVYPDITVNDMIESVADSIITQMGMPELQARRYAELFIPTLKRWKTE